MYMKELLYTVAAGLVADPASISITQDEPDAEGVIVLHLHVAAEDMGRVIGKQGRIAKAIRSVLKAATPRDSKPVFLEIQ